MPAIRSLRAMGMITMAPVDLARLGNAARLPILAVLTTALAFAQGGGRGTPLVSLKRVAVPTPTNLSVYVKDQKALVTLGKALFWDMQAGSDGVTACATCHFHAGADHRVKNLFALPASGIGSVAANQTATASSFPFHQLSNVASNSSTVLKDTRQVAGSPGVFARKFSGADAGQPAERGSDVRGGTASVGGLNVRQVTNRNTPSVINAVFNVRNFWDGRASRLFTGQTPFGASDTGLHAVVFRDGKLVREAVAINNASLASQAAGPPLNSLEMSYDGRTWPLLGRKLLSLAPLAGQRVAPDDSVLGALANTSGNGLLPVYTYSALIQAAFQPTYWSGQGLVDGQYTQTEANFAIFWALAIQAYETTLVSDDARIDQFLDGNQQALTALEQQGLQVFQRNDSQCTQCHQGAEFTGASFTVAANTAVTNTDPDNSGFFRTAVTPMADDPGLGALDGFGNVLFPASPARAAGTFKSPGLRNVEFTGPYFHDGGQATLAQVMQFYARNGDFPAGGNLGPGMGRINLSAADQAALVAFMNALSDDRVRYERAPFDHPSLCVSKGATELSPGVLEADTSNPLFSSSATERFGLVGAVGKGGNLVPLQTFDEMLSGLGNDGSRAHTLAEACTPALVAATRLEAVTHAASFTAGPVAPGQIVTLFGTNLSGDVTFDGVKSATLYASPTQVNVTVPFGITGSTTTVQVGSASLQLAVVPSAPGIFAAVSSGAGLVTLYATGGGKRTAETLPRFVLPVSVSVNGQAAEVLYAGVAPTLPEGADQVNIRIPAGTPTGTVNIVLTVGSASSKAFSFTP